VVTVCGSPSVWQAKWLSIARHWIRLLGVANEYPNPSAKSEAGSAAAVGAATSGVSATGVCSEPIGVDAVAVDPSPESSDEQPATRAVRASAATAAATCRAIWVTGILCSGEHTSVSPESDRSLTPNTVLLFQKFGD
jgi:hypothetical protein